MASAEKYAAWIVANADKRGTPEFNTVAKAYQEAKARGVQPPKAAPEATKRLQAITAEEKAARERLAQRARELKEYEESLVGRVLSAPSRLFGMETYAEESLARSKEKAAERLDLLRREREFIQRTGRTAPPPTVGQRITGTLKSIPRGAIEGTFQGLGQMGILGEEGEDIARSAEAQGKKLAEDLGLGADEVALFDPMQQNLEAFGGGLGGIFPYLAAGVLGGKAAPAFRGAPLVARGAQAVLATGQGATQARQQMDEFEAKTGQKIDPTTRQLVQATGGAINLTELLPIGRMIDTLPAPVREAATRNAARDLLQGIESSAAGRIATRGFAPEALQEGGVQLAQNVLERTAYNPEQDVFEGVQQSAVLGGLVGGTVRSGVEVTNALGGRAAANRQRAFEQNMGAVPPAEEFDINVRSPEDPTQFTRQRVQRLTDPDADGNVFARRPDGTIFQTAMTELYRMRVPTEGIRAIPIPETLSAPAVTERLTASLGETTVDPDIQSYIKSVTTTLNNNMALGTPENTETYLQKQQNSLRRSRLPEEARIARMLVLDEAAKLNNEYLGLVTAPPAAPDTAPTAAPEVTEQPAVVSDEQIQSQVDAMREMSARRTAALESIAGDPEVVDKVSAFEDLMAQDGFGAPTPVETTYLLDVMRAESEAETATGQQKDMTDRQRIVDRANIIEGVLYDDRVPMEKKAERIGVKLRNKGYKPLNRYEVERLAGFEAVNAVFGPEGEYTQRRQELMDQVLADPAITDKYRGFTEALDQFPELGDPTVDEIRMLRGDAAPIEAEIAPGGEPTPLTMQVPARPGGLPAEIIDRGVAGEPEMVEEPEMAAPEMVEEPTPEAVVEPEIAAPPTKTGTEVMDRIDALQEGGIDNEELRDFVTNQNWQLVELQPEELPTSDELIDNEDPFNRVLDISDTVVERYKREFSSGAEVEPIVFADGVVIDGNHRAQAAIELGIPIRAYVPTQTTPQPTPAPQAAPEPTQAPEQPAQEEVALAPYKDVALSTMWYSGGSRTAVSGTEKPSWVPDDVMVYNESGVQVEQFKAKDGTIGTKVSVSVPSIDEKFGDRGNHAAATVWLRNADPKDIDSAIQTAEAVARWVADPKNPKARGGPLDRIADQAIKFVAERGGTTKAATPAPAPAPQAAPEPTPAPEQPAPTAATQVVNNPEEDIAPVEERLEADPNTVEGAFPASLNRPRAEAIGFAADLEQRVKRMSSRFTRALNYKYQNAADYSQALAASYGLTRLPDNLNVARKFELLESRKIGGQMRLNRWYLQPIEDKIKELGLDPKDVGMYLWARSAPARNALIRKRNAAVQNGSGMSDAQAQAQLDKLELEGLGPKLREVAKLHDALVDYIGNQRVKAGLISRADWKAMRKAQPFYTPLKGYALDGDMQVDGDPDPHSAEERGIAESNGTRVREVLTSRGRESMPFNPLFNLMSDAQFAIARIEQNKVKETFLNNVLSDPKSHEGLVKVYTPKKERHASGLVTMPKIGPNGPVNMNQIAAQKNPELMIVKKDGKPYYIEFARTPAGNALYRAFANMTPPEHNKYMRAAQEVSNTMKSFKTRYNPIYIGSTAWARDFSEAIQTAYAAQGIKGGPAAGTKLARRTARYIASLDGMRAISGYLNGRDPTTAEGEVMTLLFDQFLEDGGAVGHAQIMDAESYAQDAVKTIERYAAAKRGKPAAAALMAKDMTAKALDNASQLIDLQARFATYRAAIEEGISREDAAALALDSSLNLTRRGELSPWLDTFVFFFSPTIEGARKLFSQGRYSAAARRLFTKTLMAGALLYLFNRFGPGEGDDDEDGRPNILDVNNATAQTRLVFRYGPSVNDYVAVPAAFGMGFFAYTGGQIMATILGDISPEEAAFNIVGGLNNMASPIKTEGTEGLTGIVNFIMPDQVQPLWDLVVNRNAFGSDIYTEQEYRTEPKSELGREETGEGWKFIARGMNSLFGGNATVEKWSSVQPEQYRYVIQQLLGGAYGLGRDTVDLMAGEAKPDQILAQRIPIIKSFFGKGGEYVPMNKFYEDYDDLNALYTVYNAEEPDYEAQAENKEKFPVETDPTVMDAFGEAKSDLRKISSDYKDGNYASKEDMYADRNEVYKKFNRIYADAKREAEE